MLLPLRSYHLRHHPFPTAPLPNPSERWTLHCTRASRPPTQRYAFSSTRLPLHSPKRRPLAHPTAPPLALSAIDFLRFTLSDRSPTPIPSGCSSALSHVSAAHASLRRGVPFLPLSLRYSLVFPFRASGLLPHVIRSHCAFDLKQRRIRE